MNTEQQILEAPDGWRFHRSSGQWIKPLFARIEPMNGGRWLTPIGVFDDPFTAMQACEDQADTVRAFNGVF